MNSTFTKEKLRILVVEDHEPDRLMICKAISQSGYNTEMDTADSVEKAVELCRNNIYDCIFLDYYFPENTGIDFINFYNESQGTGSIIVVTGQDDVRMAVECMKKGAGDFLTKNTISAATISRSISYMLKLREAKETALRAEKALMESELKLKSIIARSPVILFNIDQDGLITLFKGKAANSLSIKPEKVVGQYLKDVTDFLPIRINDYNKALIEEQLNFKTEVNQHHFDISYIPVKNEQKKITGMMGVAIDITDFKKEEASLKNTIELAEAATRIKEQFLANMSHEIRTPIHGIISLTQFVLNTQTTEDQRQYLELIRKSADTLLVIVNDILDLSKIDSGKMTFEEISFNLRDTIQSAIAVFIPKTMEKDIQLKTDFSPDLPVNLTGDPVRLTQIINNLLGNAVKFTEKGFVSIGATVREKNSAYAVIEFSIRDTGIGIPPHRIHSIFETFTQAGTDITRKYGGTGLGLSICKELIEKQNGTISVSSLVDAGTTFNFSIPFKLAVQDEPVKESTKQGVSDNLSSPLHILVAEDHDINRFIIEKMLKGWGHTCDFACTGTEAVEKVSRNSYDLVLMDVEMPDMNGCRATEMIRNEIDNKKSLPIIALTGHAMNGEREKCLESGMNDYISKPFKAEELKAKIKQYAYSNISISTPQIQSKITDLTFLREISENNDQFFREFIQMFLRNTPQALQDIRNGLETLNWESIRQAAHKVKPSFNYVGLKDLNLMSGKIEELAKKNENAEEIKSLLQQITDISTKAFAELEEELKSITLS